MSYATTILADAPSYYWKLNDPSGGAVDSAAGGANTGTYQGTVTRGQAGPPGTGDNATLFNGSTGYVSTTTSIVNPTNPFTLEGWFKTTSAAGGTIIAFNNAQTGAGASEDRNLYVGTDGKVYFGIFTSTQVIVASGLAYNDGNWHYAAGVIASNGNMSLYVDGALVSGPNANVTAPVSYTGFWRIAWFTTSPSGWTNSGTVTFFPGTLTEVAVYPAALTSGQVAAHYAAGQATTSQQRRPVALPLTLGPAAVRKGGFPFQALFPPPPVARVPSSSVVAQGPTGALAAGVLSDFLLAGGTLPVPPSNQQAAGVYQPRRQGPAAVGPTFFAALKPAPAPAPTVQNQTVFSATLGFTGNQVRAVTKLLAAILTFTGSLTRATAKLLVAAALTFTGALAKQTPKALTATLTFAGSRTLSIGKALSGALTFTGAQARAITKGLVAALSFTGKLTKSLARTLTAAVLTSAGAVTKQTGKPLAAVLGLAGAMTRLPGKSFSAALSFTGAQSRSVGKGLAANLSFVGALRKVVTKGLAATLTFSGALSRQTAKKLTGVLTFSGGFTTLAVHAFTQAFTATLTFAGVTTRQTGKALAGALSFTGKQSRAIGHTLTAVASFTGAQARAVTQHLTAALTSTGRLTKSIGKKIAGALSFVGNLVPVHNGPSNAPPTICYPTTALIVPYASAPGFAPRETGVTMRPYTTTTTIPARSSSIAIAPRSTVGSITGHDTAGTLVIYTSGVTHFNTCND